MKRFWKEAKAVPAPDGWGIELDGRPVRTPGRAALVVPTEPLAQAIAAEWGDCADTVDPRAMPLTGLANAAIDRVAPDPETFAAGLAKYGESDLFCYRAEGPQKLIDRQEEAWGALLAWARRRYDVDFAVTGGLVHVAQPQATVARLNHAVAMLAPFRLAALSPLVTIGGSLVAALAVAEGDWEAERVWEAVSLDDAWQAEQWGADSEAVAALANKRRDFLAAARFLKLLG